jgi:hypothetical protein
MEPEGSFSSSKSLSLDDDDDDDKLAQSSRLHALVL